MEHQLPIARNSFLTAQLVASFPPVLRHPHKQLVYRLSSPPHRPHAGTLFVTRWAAMPIPKTVPERETRIDEASGFFDYQPTGPAGGEMRWYVNFADRHLFGAYGGPLLAQDELQVAEHPALGSLCEALAASELPPLTRDGARCSPILIRGVERRCRIATDVNAAEGRPLGLYGNRFASAPVDAIERAVELLDPPTITNIVAMEAPKYGRGAYTQDQIEDALTTAITSFTGARLESAAADRTTTCVHTGFWGCGAYGGNRTLMALLQLVAARIAGLERLAFHTSDVAGAASLEAARRTYGAEVHGGDDTDELVERILQLGFVWGISDGN